MCAKSLKTEYRTHKFFRDVRHTSTCSQFPIPYNRALPFCPEHPKSQMTKVLLIALMTLAAASSDAQIAATTQPPVAKKVHTERTLNGVTLTDDYAWLRERDNPDVKALPRSRERLRRVVMKPTQARQKKLYDEIVSHIKETDDYGSLPQGRLLLLHPHAKGKTVLRCYAARRARSTPASGSRIILRAGAARLNQMAEGENFMAVGHSRSVTMATGWRTPPTMWDSASTGCTSATCVPCRTCPTRPSASLRSPGPRTTGRCSTLSKMKSRSAAIAYIAIPEE